MPNDPYKSTESRLPHRATYNLPEVAILLGVSRTSIYRWAERGLFPTIKLGRRLLVPRVAVEELLNPLSGAQNVPSDGEAPRP